MIDVRNKLSRRGAWLVLAACLVLLPLQATAQEATDAAPGPLADTWIIWAKQGHGEELAQALKAHAAWRKQAGDPFSWMIFQPVVGDDLGHYVVRSEGHHWKDFDATDAWGRESGAGKQFSEQVGAHVERVEHYISEDSEHTYWPQSDREYPLFGVGSYQLQPGSMGAVNKALARIKQAATEKRWSRPFGIGWNIGGDGGMTVVWPYVSWADMKDPDPSFTDVLGESMGSKEEAQKLMGDLGRKFKKSSYTIYRVRPDLSTPK